MFYHLIFTLKIRRNHFKPKLYLYIPPNTFPVFRYYCADIIFSCMHPIFLPMLRVSYIFLNSIMFYVCFSIIVDIDIMSYMFLSIDGVYSYSNAILLVYNIFCTLLSTFCYVSVLISIRRANKNVVNNIHSNTKKQEAR